MTKEVYFVHAVDTEGPLYESLEAKFDRIKNIYNIDIKDKSEGNLKKLRNKEISLGGMEKEIAEMLSGPSKNLTFLWLKDLVLFDEKFSYKLKVLDKIICIGFAPCKTSNLSLPLLVIIRFLIIIKSY